MVPRHGLILVYLLGLASCDAQQANDRNTSDGAAKAPPDATVTGHVYLDDTKAPGRKATVYLEAAATLQADAAPKRNGNEQNGRVTASVETQFDGGYSFTHVPSGSYYVMATCPGYISPFVALSLTGESVNEERTLLGPAQKAAKDRILDALPRVDVLPGVPATADITLQRGGAVSGNIAYDDGGPAAGLEVKALVRRGTHGKETWSPLTYDPHSFANWNRTDDRGNYRISGLPPGKYVVEVALDVIDTKNYDSPSRGATYSSNAHGARLSIYSGSTPHQSEATGFTLQAREERTGEDIQLPMSKLHTIRGNIVSALDGHVINSGQVDLLRADDHSIAGYQNLTEDDPGFTFSFIFEGDYVLWTPLSSDMDYEPVGQPGSLGPPEFKTHIVRFYGTASQPLHVTGDMQGVTIAVPEPTPQEAQADEDIRRAQEAQEQRQNQKPATAPQ